MMEIHPLILTTLTPTHTGAGRSPGIVDLPVIKDPQGYPFIPGTMIKGALKTMLANEKKCIDDREGSIQCNKNNDCKTLCCLLGADEAEYGASRLAITDFYPLAIPVPSLETGLVYVTSPLLIARAEAILETVNKSNLKKAIADLSEKVRDNENVRALRNRSLLYTGQANNNKLHIVLEVYNTKKLELNKNNIESLKKTLTTLNPIYKQYNPLDNLVVAHDTIAPKLIERGLIRVTRIALDRRTKTVKEGALWTEEYIPHASLFIGAIIDSKWTGRNCENNNTNPVDWLINNAGKDHKISLIIGGKETVGKGLVTISEEGKPK